MEAINLSLVARGSMIRHKEHSEQIDYWIERATKGLDLNGLHALFEIAITALWKRTNATISAVTLVPIFERALVNTEHEFYFLSETKVDEAGVRFEEGRKKQSVEKSKVIEGYRFLLIELLCIIGNLTDDVLTPGLYSALSGVSNSSLKEKRHLKIQGEL